MGSPIDVILNDAQTATGAGSGVIGFAREQRYSKGAGVNRGKYLRKFKVRAALTDSTTGATATLLIEHCDDNSTWVTLGSIDLSLAAGSTRSTAGRLFSTSKKYVRGNVSALASGSAPKVDAYLTLGGFGA